MSTDWTNVAKGGSDLGPELVFNGGFVGGTSGWTLESGWSYDSNDVLHTPFNTGLLYQENILNNPNFLYEISGDTTGTTGEVGFGAGDHSGVYQTTTVPLGGPFVLQILGFPPGDFICAPSADFDGTVTNLSVKQVGVTNWNEISKPSPLSWFNIPNPSNTSTSYGTPYGLLLAILRTVTVGTDSWTKIADNVSSWTKVADNATSWNSVPKAT